MITNTRQRGAIATVLDPETLLHAGRAALADQYPDYDPARLEKCLAPQMLLPVDRGEAAVVNTEGVGGISREDGTVNVWFGYRLGFERFPISISLEALAAAVTEEHIDIADGIRVFGARLDTNHALWFRRYDKESKKVLVVADELGRPV